MREKKVIFIFPLSKQINTEKEINQYWEENYLCETIF